MAAHRFFGEVQRLYVTRPGLFVRLENVTPTGEPLPKDQYFLLERDHRNYDSLYSLALLAASGRHRLQIRTSRDADPSEHAEVAYMVLDW